VSENDSPLGTPAQILEIALQKGASISAFCKQHVLQAVKLGTVHAHITKVFGYSSTDDHYQLYQEVGLCDLRDFLDTTPQYWYV